MHRFCFVAFLGLVACDEPVDPPPGPGPLCREGCSYVCGSQCPDICAAHQCWSKGAGGGWQLEAVDCATNCNDL